jgi:hypothetical protein
MKRRLHVHDLKFVLQRAIAHASALLKGGQGEMWISNKSVVLVQKRKALTGEKEHCQFIRVPSEFAYMPGLFELLQSLFGGLFSAIEIQSCGMSGSHDAGLKEPSEQCEVALLKLYGVNWHSAL